MCGILFSNNKSLYESLKPVIKQRGTDWENEIEINESIHYSSVLSIRKPLCKQPVQINNKIIQFNGELYNEETIDGNDTAFIVESIEKFGILKTIGKLRGEFAYLIRDLETDEFWFGKDSIGKRSLCFSSNGDISSCWPVDANERELWEECEANFIYHLKNGELNKILLDKNENDQVVNSLEINVDVKDLHQRLKFAVEERLQTIHPNKHCANLAILFSGGIDCTLIAGLCGEVLNERSKDGLIHLLNVSFQNPRAKLGYDDTPDRKLAIKSTQELNEKYGPLNVKFELIKINVPYEDYLEAKSKVMQLIYPNDTEMDLSIAIAFYFASSGGFNDENSNNINNCNCKVLMSGLGADELFGGYTRHERIFTELSNNRRKDIKKGLTLNPINKNDLISLYKELRDELQLDIERIWIRNLSRDDKVISTWSKEARYPFLDVKFINWVKRHVSLDYKVSIDDSGKIIRKVFLRKLANYMGLFGVENEPKRAIQFGSKSAKMDIGSGKIKGTDKVISLQ